MWDGAPEACTSPASHTFADDGAHSVFVTATDPAGNPGLPSSSFSYTLDRRQPQITFDAVPPDGSTRFTILWHVDETQVSFFCGVDGGPANTCVTTDGVNGSSFVDVRSSGTTQHHFTVEAIDQAGNTNIGVATWTTM